MANSHLTKPRNQARAIRRCGELLKQIEPGTGKYQSKSKGDLTLVDRKQAAAKNKVAISHFDFSNPLNQQSSSKAEVIHRLVTI